MIKKIAAFAGAAAMLATAATPAMAYVWFPQSSDDTTNTAVVTNVSTANANTGYNDQYNKAYGGHTYRLWSFGGGATVEDNAILTGNAWADSKAVVVANTQVGCGCEQDGDVENTAVVMNTSSANADTGRNSQYNKAYGSGWVKVLNNGVVTGNAGAESDAWTVANTDLSGWAF